MNVKINIATKQIELLDNVPFDEAKKLVDALIAAYGWEAKDVRIKSVTEYISPAPIIIHRRPWYDPYQPYVTWCTGAETTNQLPPLTTINDTPTITYTASNTN